MGQIDFHIMNIEKLKCDIFPKFLVMCVSVARIIKLPEGIVISMDRMAIIYAD